MRSRRGQEKKKNPITAGDDIHLEKRRYNKTL